MQCSYQPYIQGRRQELMRRCFYLPSLSSPSLLSPRFPSLSIPCIFFPFFSPPFPLEVGPLKPARGSVVCCKLPHRGPGRSTCWKRIWFTLELSECHKWQSFWVLWSACFTVDRSKSSTALLRGVKNYTRPQLRSVLTRHHPPPPAYAPIHGDTMLGGGTASVYSDRENHHHPHRSTESTPVTSCTGYSEVLC